MTPQEIFDRVAAHLLNQGRRSVRTDEFYGCAYRGRDGLRCAAGALIPDDEYNPDFEGEPVTRRRILLAIGVSPNDGDAVTLLARLQDMHDEKMPSRWESELEELAAERGLSTEILRRWRSGEEVLPW